MKSENDQRELDTYRKNALLADEKRKSEMENGKRVYKSEERFFDHDLWKLLIAVKMHDVGLDGVYIGERCVIKPKPRYVEVDHIHFFHSYDSNGRKQTHSNSIAGHCHKIDVMKNEDGTLIAKCGPAIIRQGVKFYPMKDSKSIHTHDVEYQVSEKLPLRVTNKEAQKHGLK